MTISSQTSKVSYAANGSTTIFAVPFYFLAIGDLKVIYRAANGTETVKTLTTDYTVSGAGNQAGGSITTTSAAATGITVVIARNTSYTQEVDYLSNDPFPAETHETALDKLTMEVQQVNEAIGRAIKLSQTNTITSTEFTIGAASRANKIFAFDSSGELSITQELGTFRSTWVTATSYTVRDIVKDNTNNNIYICVTSHTSTGSLPISANAGVAYWSLLVDAESASSSATAAASSATAAATSETNALSHANAAQAAAASIFWDYASTTAMADPGTGKIRVNNATLSLITAVAVSAQSNSTGNPDVSDYIVTWDDSTSTTKGHIIVRESGAPDTVLVLAVSGSVTDNGSWLQIPVTYVASAGSLSNGDDLYLSFSRSGDAGVGDFKADGTVAMTGSLQLGTGTALVFEGATADQFETTVTVVDPSADRTITIPNADSYLPIFAHHMTFSGPTTARTYTLPDSAQTLAALGANQTFTVSQRGAITALSDASTVTPDFASANNYSLTIAGNRTLANPTNQTAGQSGVIVITQDGTGSRTLAYGSNYKFAGGTAPTLTTTASAVDVLVYYVESASRITATLINDVK